MAQTSFSLSGGFDRLALIPRLTRLFGSREWLQSPPRTPSCQSCSIRSHFANYKYIAIREDGTSSYQMLAGILRFVCQNGTVAGDDVADIRVPHKGNIVQNVINGAFDVLDGFDLIREQKEGMRAVTLDGDEQHAFARSALALRYDPTDAEAPAPVTDSQLLAPRRFEDRRDDL